MNAKKAKRLRKLARQFVLSNFAREKLGQATRPLSVFSGFSKDEKKKIAKEIACFMEYKEAEFAMNETHRTESQDPVEKNGF